MLVAGVPDRRRPSHSWLVYVCRASESFTVNGDSSIAATIGTANVKSQSLFHPHERETAGMELSLTQTATPVHRRLSAFSWNSKCNYPALGDQGQEEAGLLAKHPGLNKVDWLSISWARDHNFVSISYLPSLALEVQACLYPSPWLSFSSCSVHPILYSNSQS